MSRSTRMCGGWGVAVILAALLAVGGARAGDRSPGVPHGEVDLRYGVIASVDLERADCCDTVFAPAEEPAWVAAAIARMQREGPETRVPRQHVLFHHRGRPTYLVVHWRDQLFGWEQVQAFRARDPGAGWGRLTAVLELEQSGLGIMPPTGRWRDLDGVPLLVVYVGSGGTDLTGYELRIFRIAEAVSEVTFEETGRIVAVTDADSDGVYELVAEDDRWAHLFYGCGPCGPSVPVFLTRTRRGFAPDCRRYRGAMTWHVRYLRDRIAGGNGDFGPRHFADVAEIALGLAQVGEGDRGLEELDRFLDRARARVRAIARSDRDLAAWMTADIRRMANRILPAVVAARGWPAAACPLSATALPGANYEDEDDLDGLGLGPD